MSHSEINRRIVLTSRPKGTPVPGDFLFEEAPVPAPGQGGVLLRTLYLSLDPYMRGMMNERAPAYTRSIAIGGSVVAREQAPAARVTPAGVPAGRVTFVTGALLITTGDVASFTRPAVEARAHPPPGRRR